MHVIFAGSPLSEDLFGPAHPEAEAQLDALYQYVAAEAGEATARRYIDAIIDFCHTLATFPSRGSPRPDLGPGLRSISYRRRCLIVYQVDGDMVWIVAALYGGRDTASVFRR